MSQFDNSNYEIYEEFDNNSGTIYHKKDTNEEYLIIPIQTLNQAYGYYFIDRDLLFRADLSAAAGNALVKNVDTVKNIHNIIDPQQYRQLLKVDFDDILPTIANAEHRQPLEIATEEFSLSGQAPHIIQHHGQTCYVFDY